MKNAGGRCLNVAESPENLCTLGVSHSLGADMAVDVDAAIRCRGYPARLLVSLEDAIPHSPSVARRICPGFVVAQADLAEPYEYIGWQFVEVSRRGQRFRRGNVSPLVAGGLDVQHAPRVHWVTHIMGNGEEPVRLLGSSNPVERGCWAAEEGHVLRHNIRRKVRNLID